MVYYENSTGDNYQRYSISQFSKHLTISNDGANSLDFSANGSDRIGRIDSKESITFDFINECNIIDLDSVYIKSYIAGASTSFRLWGW